MPEETYNVELTLKLSANPGTIPVWNGQTLVKSHVFNNDAHAAKCCIIWNTTGYPFSYEDNYGRKIRARISPESIAMIRYWIPFDNGINLQQSNKEIKRG